MNDDTKRFVSPAPATAGLGEARIVVLTGIAAGRSFDVEPGMVVGRAPDSQLRLDETSVSRYHARIERDERGRWVLVDLDSRNGTLVNDEPVERHPLAYGDRINVGGQSMLLFTHHHPLEEQLRRKQRMEAIGELSSGIAHDFNNLLGAVLASVEYLRDLPADRSLGEQDVQACLSDIMAAAVRGAELTERLLGVARRGRSGDESVDVGRLVQEVVQIARRTFPRRIEVRSEIAGDLVVIGDRSQLYHMLLNLCINARDALPEGGTLTIQATRGTDGDDQVRIVVRDTGIGMDAETLKRAFEPFFTTKGGDAGSGLGLASVQATVKGHGGRIEVDSAPGQGTTFRITLPTHTKATPRTPVYRPTPRRGLAATRPDASQSTGLVLLVDDNQVLRRSLARILRQVGHDVVLASDGLEALHVFRSSTRRPDVVVLDLDMPRLGGEEAFAKLKELDPDVRVLFLSGLASEEQRSSLLQQGALDCLQKPCDTPTLLATISAALRSD